MPATDTQYDLKLGLDTGVGKQDVDNVTDSLFRAGDAADRVASSSTKAAGSTKLYGTSSKGAAKAAKSAATATGKFDTRITRLDRSMGKILKTGAAVIAGWLTFSTASHALTQAVDIFTDVDSALVAVAKTTGITGGELRALEDDVTRLSSTAIPELTTDLLDLGAAAGQLGVEGSENILQYVETIAKLGAASDLQGENAAKVLTRILNVQGEAPEEIERLASVIVRLGNNSAATESEIARITNEVSLATAAFKIGSTNAAAYGAALAEIGVRAELGGSVIGRTMRAIQEAVTEGGKTLETFAEVAGTSVEEFTELWEKDAVAAFNAFLKGLGTFGQESGAVLEELGLRGEEVAKVLPPLAVNFEKLAAKMALAKDEAVEVTALEREAAAAYATTQSDLDRLTNAYSAVAKEVGRGFSPALRAVALELRDFLDTNQDAAFAIGQTLGDALKSGADLVRFLAENVDLLKGALLAFLALKLAAWFTGFVGAVGRAVAALIAYTASTGGATAATAALGTTVTRVSPILNQYGKAITVTSTASAAATTSSSRFLSLGITPLAAGLGVLLAALVASNSAITRWSDNLDREIADTIASMEGFFDGVQRIKDASADLLDLAAQEAEIQKRILAAGAEAGSAEEATIRAQVAAEAQRQQVDLLFEQEARLEAVREKQAALSSELDTARETYTRLAAAAEEARLGMIPEFPQTIEEFKEAAGAAEDARQEVTRLEKEWQQANIEGDTLAETTRQLREATEDYVPAVEEAAKGAGSFGETAASAADDLRHQIEVQREANAFALEFGVSAESARKAAEILLSEDGGGITRQELAHLIGQLAVLEASAEQAREPLEDYLEEGLASLGTLPVGDFFEEWKRQAIAQLELDRERRQVLLSIATPLERQAAIMAEVNAQAERLNLSEEQRARLLQLQLGLMQEQQASALQRGLAGGAAAARGLGMPNIGRAFDRFAEAARGFEASTSDAEAAVEGYEDAQDAATQGTLAAARGAIDLALGVGILDEEAAKTAQNLTTIGAAIGKAFDNEALGGAIGAAVGFLGIDFGRTGNQIAEGAALGAQVGGGWGALIGAVVGWAVDAFSSTAEAFTDAGTTIEGLNFNAVSGELSDQAIQFRDAVEGIVNDTLEILGGVFTEFNTLAFLIREDSKGIRVAFNGVWREFGDDMRAAIDFAVTTILKQTDISGLSDVARSALENVFIQTVDDLEALINTIVAIEDTGLTSFGSRLAQRIKEQNALLEAAIFEIGAGAADVLGGPQGIVSSFRSAMVSLGLISEDVGEQRRAEIEALRTQMEVQRAHLLVLKAQIEAEVLAAEARGETTRIVLLQQGAFLEGMDATADGLKEFGRRIADLGRTSAAAAAVLGGSAEALAAITQALADLDTLLETGFSTEAIDRAVRRAEEAAGAGGFGPDRDAAQRELDLLEARERGGQAAFDLLREEQRLEEQVQRITQALGEEAGARARELLELERQRRELERLIDASRAAFDAVQPFRDVLNELQFGDFGAGVLAFADQIRAAFDELNRLLEEGVHPSTILQQLLVLEDAIPVALANMLEDALEGAAGDPEALSELRDSIGALLADLPAELEPLRGMLTDFFAQLGIEIMVAAAAAAKEEFQRQQQALRDVREAGLSLGQTLVQTIDRYGGAAQITEEQRIGLLRLEFELTKAQIILRRRQIEEELAALELLGVATAAIRAELSLVDDLISILVDLDPVFQDLGTSASSAGSSVNTLADDIARLQQEIDDQIVAWRRLELGPLANGAIDLRQRFEDLEAEALRLGISTEELAAAYRRAASVFIDDALTDLEERGLSGLERDFRQLNRELADMHDAMLILGASTEEWARFADAARQALEDFWEQAFQPLRDILADIRDEAELPREAFETSRAEFLDLVARAQAGDLDAIEQLPAAAQAFREQIAAFFGEGIGADFFLDELTRLLEDVVDLEGRPTFQDQVLSSVAGLLTSNQEGFEGVGSSVNFVGASIVSQLELLQELISAEDYAELIEALGEATLSDIVEAIGAQDFALIVEAIGAIDTAGIITAIGAEEFIEIVEAIGALDFIEIVTAIGAIDTAGIITAIGAEDFIEVVEAIGAQTFAEVVEAIGALDVAGIITAIGAEDFAEIVAALGPATLADIVQTLGSEDFSQIVEAIGAQEFIQITQALGELNIPLGGIIAAIGNQDFAEIVNAVTNSGGDLFDVLEAVVSELDPASQLAQDLQRIIDANEDTESAIESQDPNITLLQVIDSSTAATVAQLIIANAKLTQIVINTQTGGPPAFAPPGGDQSFFGLTDTAAFAAARVQRSDLISDRLFPRRPAARADFPRVFEVSDRRLTVIESQGGRGESRERAKRVEAERRHGGRQQTNELLKRLLAAQAKQAEGLRQMAQALDRHRPPAGRRSN